MKSYTDLEQSKQLAKFLPFESADMGWYYSRNPQAARNQMWVGTKTENADIPCWSLAALLDALPKGECEDIDLCFGGYNNMIQFVPEWFCSYEQQEPVLVKVCSAQNAIDACYELVLKLHELNLL